VALHVLRHVEADELDAQHERELAGDLGLADACRPANRNEPTGFFWSPSPERDILIAEESVSIARSWP